MGQHDPRSGLKPAGKSARPLPSRRSKPTAYVRHTAGGGQSAATVIAGSKQILDSGTITQAEYDKLKAKALA